MVQEAPGKSHRKGITLAQLVAIFPDDATAGAWFAKARWAALPLLRIVQCRVWHQAQDDDPSAPRLPEAADVLAQDRHDYGGIEPRLPDLGDRAVYLVATNLKGVSSMTLHRDLGVTQKTAWHLAHRIRNALGRSEAPFSGPVEVDETYVGSKRKNVSNAKRKALAGTAVARPARRPSPAPRID